MELINKITLESDYTVAGVVKWAANVAHEATEELRELLASGVSGVEHQVWANASAAAGDAATAMKADATQALAAMREAAGTVVAELETSARGVIERAVDAILQEMAAAAAGAAKQIEDAIATAIAKGIGDLAAAIAASAASHDAPASPAAGPIVQTSAQAAQQ
jgi:sorbitol-specific phosphotransferase system component IIBC